MQLWLLMPVLKHLTVGIPEGRYHLAAASGNCTQVKQRHGLFDALAAEREREAEVPTHLKDANRDKKGFGHGAGYLYPHAYRDRVVQQYLPASLQGQVFYQPSGRVLKRKLVRRSLVVVKPNWKL